METMNSLNTAIDELALLCVDWRNARKNNITSPKIRTDIVAQILEVMNQKGEEPPKWFREVFSDIDEILKKGEE